MKQRLSLRRRWNSTRHLQLLLGLWRITSCVVEIMTGRSKSQKALEQESADTWALGATGFAHLYKGEPTKALAVFQKQRELEGLPPFALEGIGRSYAAMGKRAQALKIINELTAKQEYVSSFPIATIYLQLGDKAIEYLEKDL